MWGGGRVNGFVSGQGSAPSAVSVTGDTGRNEVGLKGPALGVGLGLGHFCKARQHEAEQQY